MDLRSTLGSLLLVLGLCGICMGFIPDDCFNYKLQFERVFSVPGDMAMLSSTLVSSDVFNFTTVPYNITWYDSKTSREICDQAGRILVRRDTLWFLNITLDDDGEYVTILRTPTQCYRQDTKLVVDLPSAGECERPRKAGQTLTMRVTDTLVCPLKDYIKKLDSYNITSSVTWQRGCDPIVDGTGSYTYRDRGAKLKIDGVELQHNTPHTCTLTFTLGGITGTVSETIEAWVKEEYTLVPEVREPASEIVKAQMGSSLSKRCLVFVPCVGKPHVDIFWLVGKTFIFTTNSSARIYTSKQNSSKDDFRQGVWLERVLTISELREEDFNINYTCRAYSDRGSFEGYFTLLPADPNIILPIGVVLGGVMVLFIISVCIYYQFKVDIVLWFRSAFPIFYANTDLDGKLYDAYVAYPSSCAFGYSKDVAMFALHTLPQVLENACGYKLFIAGRDCLPGQAIADSVEENIQASRCLLLLYTASTFANKRHTSSTSCNNNNISEISESSDNTESKTRGHSSCPSSDGGEEFYPDTRQQLERVAAMHRALLEKSLKVVLVELEEITPAQLALFPESVRHLRKKQGAVCWWKNQRPRQRLTSSQEDEEKGGEDMQVSSSHSPSLRFWKELRYHMPVRGKRVVYPEKMALLNL